jgi:hypothetical protein
MGHRDWGLPPKFKTENDRRQLINLLDKFGIKYKEGVGEYYKHADKPYVYIEGCGCYHIFSFEKDSDGGNFIDHELSE